MFHRNSTACGWFAIMFSALFALASAARGDTLETIKSRGTLRWGGDAEGGGPFVFPREDNPSVVQGFEVELAELLANKLGVKPADNATSRSLKAGGDKNIARLKASRGAEFDRAYMENEVAYHQAVLEAVDKTLIPNAKNEELKGLIVQVRPAFVAHLEHAKKVRAALK